MRRAAIERPRTLRVWRAHVERIHRGSPGSCPCERQPGRFRKGQRIGGCPSSKCRWKDEKRFGVPDRQARRSLVTGADWRRELD